MTDLRDAIARALSIPEHHTGWDKLTDRERDLFYMQADYAIKAFAQPTPTISQSNEATSMLHPTIYGMLLNQFQNEVEPTILKALAAEIAEATARNSTLPDGIEGLLQRLERKNCDHWPDEQCCACLVNPDGPEAASTIRSLQDQLEALRRGEAA